MYHDLIETLLEKLSTFNNTIHILHLLTSLTLSQPDRMTGMMYVATVMLMLVTFSTAQRMLIGSTTRTLIIIIIIITQTAAE